MGDRRARLVLAAILAVVTASVLWAVGMPAPHTGGDNAAYLSLAQSLATGDGYTEIWDPDTPPHTKYPPGFPLLLSLLVAAGASSWAAFKSLVMVLTFGAVMLVFAWASRREGVLLGGAVATVTLVSAGWLQASRWVLSEPLFLLLLFLAFWALEPGEGRREEAAAGPDRTARSSVRIAVGCLAAGLAVFTRTAGLPLVFAVIGALAIERRWAAAGAFVGGLAVPGVWWLGRSLRGGEGAYQSEFWLLDPYQPELGTIGLLDLPVRVVRNLLAYVGRVIPSEWWGTDVPFATPASSWALGLALVGLAGWGWVLRARRSPGAVELFVPLYVGLILVWPETWAGDRFSLPLYPIILVYGATAVTAALTRVSEERRGIARSVALAAAFLVLAGPAVPRWMSLSSESDACRRATARDGPMTCTPLAFQELGVAAAWMGTNLPPDAAVFSRKPRLFYLLGGQRGRTFPFTRSPERFLEEADRIGIRYVLLDRLDGISSFYLPPVIGGRPDAFCHIGGWSNAGAQVGTELFGILPASQRGRSDDITVCPESYGTWPGVEPAGRVGSVPRLAQDPADPEPALP